jgi:mannan endo-1,4-beta-mannosidase
MKNRLFNLILLSALTVIILSASCTNTKKDNKNVITTDGMYIHDVNGDEIIMRGVNEMFIWADDVTGKEIIPEIAKTGANTLRIVWLSDEQTPDASPGNLDKVIQNSIDNGMFPMPELHGATGKFEKLQEQVDYWVKPEVVEVLKKHEPYLMINIANECGDHSVEANEFRTAYQLAIDRIRATGLRCPLVIDASGWGQDLDILLETGHDLIAHDPENNIILSVHMWWVAHDGSTQRIIEGIERAVEMDLPLIVGEFAPMGVACKKYIDYESIMEQCEINDIGWLAWSWGAVKNGDCAEMDMTRGEYKGMYNGLTDWGLEVALTNTFSIQNTSERTKYLESLMK